MQISTLSFESHLTLIIKDQPVTLTVFKTAEPGNIKIGINAPRGIRVDREEIYVKNQKKKQQKESSMG